jgi:hypothetical protein
MSFAQLAQCIPMMGKLFFCVSFSVVVFIMLVFTIFLFPQEKPVDKDYHYNPNTGH